MADDETTHLPPGYRLNLIGDPCVIVLRRPDGQSWSASPAQPIWNR